MALEIMNSRTLAPYFGSGLFVWGSLIGVVLAGLSLGYYYGGKKADVNPSYTTFSSIIFAAGGYALLTTLASAGIFSFVIATHLGERFTPLLAAALVLGPPSVLLGMVSPYAIRLSAKKIEKVGQTAGNLYALSTTGSIIGTFVTAFLLIPEASLTTNLYGVSAVLLISSIIGLSLRGKALAAIVIAGSIALIASPPVPTAGVIEQRDTLYHRLVVLDDSVQGIRTLLLDNNFHSAMDLRAPERIVYLYTGYFHLGAAYNPDMEDVLFIGGGGFSGPKRFLMDYEDITVDVVEIDGEVVEIAQQYFQAVPHERMRTFVDDGRVYLTKTDKKYDVVVLDAYGRTYVPFHLMTKEFHQLLSEHLTEDGVLVSNIITSLEGGAADLFRAELKTMREVYPRVEFYTVSATTTSSFVQNIIVVATKSDEELTKEDLLQNAEQRIKVPGIDDMINRRFTSPFDTTTALILTDDHAPVANLLNPITGQPYIKEVLTGQGSVVQDIESVEPLQESLELSPLSTGIFIAGLAIGSVILLWNRSRETGLASRPNPQSA